MAVFLTGIIYAVITAIGLASLPSKEAVIADPYFTLMELLTILIALLMLVSVAALHTITPAADKVYSLLAVVFMALMTGTTCAVHFVVLTIADHPIMQNLPGISQWLSFQWPSLVYALDILAWDLFFPLALVFLIPVFSRDGKHPTLKWVLTIAAFLSFLGLLGVVLDNMQVRNIGILGYAVLSPITFLLVSKRLDQVNAGPSRTAL
ncbi:hypothetical protein KJS94_12605 [Flavihumibacter rivuli]|uniref:hypothetical protein n=1 Tax=Flavihumibacter rivuli TaxID=2838156 RepID=UPI001BDE2967|nr:hypothetical protein [Flavihumibacter rivuli]ULQ55484.1 hypothetical protein KJS94_12605 [Flavihumibacter rivuli]